MAAATQRVSQVYLSVQSAYPLNPHLGKQILNTQRQHQSRKLLFWGDLWSSVWDLQHDMGHPRNCGTLAESPGTSWAMGVDTSVVGNRFKMFQALQGCSTVFCILGFTANSVGSLKQWYETGLTPNSWRTCSINWKALLKCLTCDIWIQLNTSYLRYKQEATSTGGEMQQPANYLTHSWSLNSMIIYSCATWSVQLTTNINWWHITINQYIIPAGTGS